MTARLHVDLAAFDHNLAVLQERVTPAELMLVVKDDAYGHGVARVIPPALAQGVAWIGAFDVPTARAVREVAGSATRIFVWMLPTKGEVAEAIALDLDLGVGDADLLEDVASVARSAAVVARVHLKIDTGLHRNGIRPEAWEAVVQRARRLEAERAIDVVGVWSHIAEASDDDDDDARALFETACAQARAAGLTPSLRHLAASSAASTRGEFRYDLVRVGAFAYGVAPAGGPTAGELGLRPVGRLTASVTEVHDVAVRIDVGAAHGLPSTLGGIVTVSTPGGRRRVIRIDPLHSVVAAWAGATVGDDVVVYGDHVIGEPTATELAEAIGTIGEEIVTRLSPRVARTDAGGA